MSMIHSTAQCLRGFALEHNFLARGNDGVTRRYRIWRLALLSRNGLSGYALYFRAIRIDASRRMVSPFI